MIKSTTTIIIFLSSLLLVNAYPQGAPTCNSGTPDHGGNDVTGAARNQMLSQMQLRMARDSNNPRNITIEVAHVTEFRGILLTPKNNFAGRFTNFNTCQLKAMENNKCVTQKDARPKPHVMTFYFLADNGNATPRFEVTIVESLKRWIKTDRFQMVSSLSG